MTTRNVGTADHLMPAQKFTEHSVTFQYSIGLSNTDDPLIGKKIPNSEFPKFDQKEKLFPADQEKIGKGEDHKY